MIITACVKSGVEKKRIYFYVCLLVFVFTISGKIEEIDSMLSPGRNLGNWKKYFLWKSPFLPCLCPLSTKKRHKH